MISPFLILQLLFSHWVSDFVLQSHWMATNKSKNLLALAAHVATYTAAFGFIMLTLGVVLAGTPHWGLAIMALMSPVQFFSWVGLNGLLHLATDFFTSKVTSSLWTKGDYHNFFVVVGLDQLIHYSCLILTLFLFI